MIKFNKPTNLNGAELKEELKAIGVSFIDEINGVLVENDDLFLDINESDADIALPIVNAHNGTTVAPEPSVQDKLASVGLSVDDLKSALGL